MKLLTNSVDLARIFRGKKHLLTPVIPKIEVKEPFIELLITRHALLMTLIRDSAYCHQAQYIENHAYRNTDARFAPVLAKDSNSVFLLSAQSTNTIHY